MTLVRQALRLRLIFTRTLSGVCVMDMALMRYSQEKQGTRRTL